MFLQFGVNELVSWSSMKEKFKQVKVDEKFEFSHLEKFYHSKNLDGMANLEKIKLNPLSS